MKMTNMSWIGLAALLAVPVCAADSPAPGAPGYFPAGTVTSPPGGPAAISGPAAQVPGAPAPSPAALSPSAAEVLKLSSAGVGDEVILAYMKNCQSRFNLSANAILRLKEAGVTSPVIAAMLTHDGSLRDQNPPAPYTYNQRMYGPGEQPPGVPAPAQPAPQPQLFAPPADQTPPPPQTEVVPVAPGPDYYWAPGYWGWDNGWIWIGGCWRPWGSAGDGAGDGLAGDGVAITAGVGMAAGVGAATAVAALGAALAAVSMVAVSMAAALAAAMAVAATAGSVQPSIRASEPEPVQQLQAKFRLYPEYALPGPLARQYLAFGDPCAIMKSILVY